MDKVISVVAGIIENYLEKPDLSKNLGDKQRFHFKLRKELFNNIGRIKEKTKWSYNKIIKNTDKLLIMIVRKLSHTKLRLKCTPASDEINVPIMEKEINVVIPTETYREVKKCHDYCNSYSMAQVWRIYFTVLVVLFETYELDELVKMIGDSSKKMTKIILDANVEFKNIQLDKKTSVSVEYSAVFDQLCYPVYTEFG